MIHFYGIDRGLGEAVKLRSLERNYTNFPQCETNTDKLMYSFAFYQCPPLRWEGTPLRSKTVKLDCSKEHIGFGGMIFVRRRDIYLNPLLESGCGALPERDNE